MTEQPWMAALAPWWPVALTVVAGLALIAALRNRRGSTPPEPPPGPDLRSILEGRAPAAQPSLGESGLPLAELALVGTPSADAPKPFAVFEVKLNEWQQNYASSDAAAHPVALAVSTDDWDDLMDIDGVDLDLARFLYGEGVHTFEQVAGMSPDELRAVLARGDAPYRDVDPSGWPESARLAVLAR